jgi:hypothetical protein
MNFRFFITQTIYGYIIGMLCAGIMIFSSLFLIINYRNYVFNLGLVSNVLFCWCFVEILLNHNFIKRRRLNNVRS